MSNELEDILCDYQIDYTGDSKYTLKEAVDKIESLLSKQREEMESKYYLVKKRDVSGYQKKYNKTEKRMNTNRHRYHKRVNKYFDDCSLCRKEL